MASKDSQPEQDVFSPERLRGMLQVAQEKLQKALAKGNQRRAQCFQQEIVALRRLLAESLAPKTLVGSSTQR